MVWVGGSQGTLAPCLVDLFLEADRRWPNRSRASDGSLGDQAHATRDSDHNPKSPNPPGWVDAGDLTDDKTSGCDADLLAHHLVASKDPRVKYVIWNGTIVRSYDRPATSTRGFLPAWKPEPYTGSNPHDKHTHISVTEAGRSIRAPWFPEEDDVALTKAQSDALDQLAAFFADNGFQRMLNTLDDFYKSGTAGDIDRIDAVIGGNLPQIRAAADAIAQRDPSSVDVEALAAELRDGLGEAIAVELGRRLTGG